MRAMAKKSNTPNLSESELRRLLLERRRTERAQRLQAFKQKGELLPTAALPAEPPDGDPLTGPRVHEAADLELAPRAATWIDRVLLAVEILAAVGLVYIFFNGLSVLNTLNSELASAFAIGAGSASPTPLIGPAVLPSGHTPPGEGQPAQPNEAEIPAGLRPQMQAYLAAIQVPTPGLEQALGIKIEALGVNAPIVQGDDWEALKRGVGQHIGSADPGQAGNLVLTGHDDIYGEVFKELDQLKPGDEVVIFTANNRYTYTITQTRFVAPTLVQVMDPTSNPTLTLISCYPYRIDSQRIVVTGELKRN